LLYAAAPGHGAAVYWLAAFTMTGAASSLFLLVWWWGRSSGRARQIGCAVLQVVALLCGEYGVAGPGLLLAVALFGARREPWRSVARDIAAPAALVLLYGIAKLAYFSVHGPGSFGYGVTASPEVILTSFGHYATATLNLLTFALGPGSYFAAAAAALMLTVASVGLALAGFAAWRPVALGTAIYVVGLLPVLALAQHYFDFFVGVATLGAALAYVALARLAIGGRNALAVALTAVVLAIDARTSDTAVRNNGIAALVRNTARMDESLLIELRRQAKANPADTVYVMPRTPLHASLFADGNAQDLFFQPPLQVHLHDVSLLPEPREGRVILEQTPTLSPEELASIGFYRDARFDWLRAAFLRLHRGYAAIEGLIAK
jgi:hypothetical protein